MAVYTTIRRAHTTPMLTEKDTVINYGKAVVKRTDNLSSDSINVLEVKVIYKAVDSFFINGSRADSTLLSSFGLKQGQTINSTNEYRFMRANETTPLVDVFYTDNTFTTANTGVCAHPTCTIVHRSC